MRQTNKWFKRLLVALNDRACVWDAEYHAFWTIICVPSQAGTQYTGATNSLLSYSIKD